MKKELVSQIMSIVDATEDEEGLISFYVDRAINTILIYLNNPKLDEDYILDNCSIAIVAMAENAYYFKGASGKIKSKSQGNRSVSYNKNTSFTITEDIVLLLPAPYIRMC